MKKKGKTMAYYDNWDEKRLKDMIRTLEDGKNIITNDKEEDIGYYDDLYRVFTKEIKHMLDARDIEGAKEQLEYLEELSEWANYDGLLVISMNNGMGFTAKPYKEGE